MLGDVLTVREALTKEKAWREKAFSGGKRALKVNEIERALQALERIEARLRLQVGDGPRYQQADMFPGGEDLPLFAGVPSSLAPLPRGEGDRTEQDCEDC